MYLHIVKNFALITVKKKIWYFICLLLHLKITPRRLPIFRAAGGSQGIIPQYKLFHRDDDEFRPGSKNRCLAR